MTAQELIAVKAELERLKGQTDISELIGPGYKEANHRNRRIEYLNLLIRRHEKAQEREAEITKVQAFVALLMSELCSHEEYHSEFEPGFRRLLKVLKHD